MKQLNTLNRKSIHHFIIAILLFNIVTINAQQPINLDSVDLKDVMFYNPENGWICGSHGVILHTTDNNNWYLQNTPTTVTLEDIHFYNTDSGFVCGDSGVIMRTYDGGENWEQLSIATNEHLYEISCYDENGGWGWVAGDSILCSTTNYFEPDENSIGPYGDTLFGFFHDASPCFTHQYTDSVVYTTLFHGAIWHPGLDNTPERLIAYRGYEDLVYIKPQWIYYDIWAVGDNGGVYYSNHPHELFPDPFAFIPSNTPDTLRLNCIDADTDGHEVWAAGINGRIEVSYNEGMDFEFYPSPTTENLNGMAFTGLDNGWIAGDKGTLLRFDGVDWQQWDSVFIPETIYEHENISVQVKLYPNPATSFFKVSLPVSQEIREVSLYNVQGKRIYNKKLDGKENLHTFSINGYTPGIYIATIKTNISIINKKLMVK